MVGRAHTFVVWSKLGEFLLRSPDPISERGRPVLFAGEAVGVLFMRSGDTCTFRSDVSKVSKEFTKLTASF